MPFKFACTRDKCKCHALGTILRGVEEGRSGLFEGRSFVHEDRAPFVSSRTRFASFQRVRHAAHVVADYREVYAKGKGSPIEDNDRLSAPTRYRSRSPCRQIDSGKWRIAVIAISNAIYAHLPRRTSVLGNRGVNPVDRLKRRIDASKVESDAGKVL